MMFIDYYSDTCFTWYFYLTKWPYMLWLLKFFFCCCPFFGFQEFLSYRILMVLFHTVHRFSLFISHFIRKLLFVCVWEWIELIFFWFDSFFFLFGFFFFFFLVISKTQKNIYLQLSVLLLTEWKKMDKDIYKVTS